jgi:hypothetical protein
MRVSIATAFLKERMMNELPKCAHSKKATVKNFVAMTPSLIQWRGYPGTAER